MWLSKEGVNGVNRLAKKGEKYCRLPTKREKNYRLPTEKKLTDYRHGPTLSTFVFRKLRSAENFVFFLVYEVTTLKLAIEFPVIFLLCGRKSRRRDHSTEQFPVLKPTKPPTVIAEFAERSPIIIQSSSSYPSSRKNLDLWLYGYPYKALLLTCVVNPGSSPSRGKALRSAENFVFFLVYEVTTLKLAIEFPVIFLLCGRKSRRRDHSTEQFPVLKPTKPPTVIAEFAERSPIIIQSSSSYPSSRKNLDLWLYGYPYKALLLTCVVNPGSSPSRGKAFYPWDMREKRNARSAFKLG